MRMDRRDFLHAGCTVAAASLIPSIIDRAEAGLHLHGVGISTPAFSQRSIINVNFFDGHCTYMFINHVASAGMANPVGAGYGAIAGWNQLIDPVTGYPNNPAVASLQWQGGLSLPKSSDYDGPWVLAWTGDGTMDANFGSWTEVNLLEATCAASNASASITATQNYVTAQKVVSQTTVGTRLVAGTTYYVCSTTTPTVLQLSTTLANAKAGTAIVMDGANASFTITPKGFIHGTGASYARNTNGNWTKRAGSTVDCYIVVKGGGSFATPVTTTAAPLKGTATGGADGFIKNVRWYRLEDEDDLLAGKFYRKPFLQQLVSLNPSAIRFMNWHGGNKDINCRWENRVPPSYASYNSSYASGPLYGDFTTPGDVNQYFTAAVATGARQTTASMQHGEIALARVAAAPVRAEGGSFTVTAITNASTAVASCAGHPFAVGDWVVHASVVGMTKLNSWPVKITAVSPGVSYSFANPLGVGLGTFTSGTVMAYISLQVGTGNDRTAYPIMYAGGAYASFFGNVSNLHMQSGFIYSYSFDKNVIGTTDGNGNPVRGAWLMNDSGGQSTTINGVPVEICTAMINELNALSVSQGITNPIHMWLNLPYRGLLSIDTADYSVGSNWAIQSATVVFNGNTVNGVTYAGLTAAAKLIYEYSNEVWNGGPSDYQTGYIQNYAIARWNNTGLHFQDAQALRAVCMARDIKAALPSFVSRMKFPLGVQSAGFFLGCTNAGFSMYYGDNTPGNIGNFYLTDSAVTGGSWGRPCDNLDGVCIAPYLEAAGSYYNSATGFKNDSARYNGTDNSGALSCTGGTGPSVTATFTAGNASIAGTNSFVAGDPVLFYSTVGNVPGDQFLTISATGLTGSTFQIKDAGNNTITPNTNGSATCVKGSTTLTVTAVAAQSLVVNQIIASGVGHGINPGVTSIVSISGSLPTLTVTLSEKAAITNGTTITSPSGGSNFIGAANTTTAIANYLAAVADPTNNDGVGSYNYTTHNDVPGSPVGAGGFFDQYSNGILAGSYVFNYEGGPNWPGTVNSGAACIPDANLLLAVTQSTQWRDAQRAVWDNYVSRSNCVMPAQYLWENVNTASGGGNAVAAWRWCYASPDTYASAIEGQALLNNPTWVNESARNNALTL